MLVKCNKVKMERQDIEFYATQIVDSAVQVHKELGPGLLESVYQYCLAEELTIRKIGVEQELSLPLFYKGKRLNKDFRIDIIVEKEIIIEVKAVEILAPVHEAQLLSYLKLADKWLGFLLNFNVPVMKQGIKRMVYGFR
jgi:GxxExxY protein